MSQLGTQRVFAFEKAAGAHSYTFIGDVQVEYDKNQPLAAFRHAVMEEVNDVLRDRMSHWDASRAAIYKTARPLDIPSEATVEEIEQAFGTVDEPFLRKNIRLRTVAAFTGTHEIFAVVDPLEPSQLLPSIPEDGIMRSQRNAPTSSQRTEAATVNSMRKKCTSPSAGARNSILMRTQANNHEEDVHNGRPLFLCGADLYLYHRVFNDFQRKLRRPLPSANLTIDEFKAAAKFIELSAQFYPTEKERQKSIQPVLDAFLGQDALIAKSFGTGSVSYMPDGSLTTVCGLYTSLEPGYSRMLKLVVELKNGIGLGDCCPTEQAEKAYQLTCIDPTLDDLRHCSCMPAFILAIAGPHISVSGAMFVNGVVVSQRITPFTSLVPPLASLSTTPGFEANEMGFVTAGTQHVAQIALLLKSLRECLDDLGTYYRDMRPTSRPGPGELSPAPCFPSFEANEGTIKLRYCSRIPGRTMVFRAEANGGGENCTRCIVKFVHRYGREAHEFMYERGVAARLMYCQKEASIGDLFVVITEYIDEAEDAKASEEGIVKLQDALKRLHDEVHLAFGDLRRVNVLIDSSAQPRLIDFDWSGPDGQMRYPDNLNTSGIAWPEGVRPFGFITKEHDMVMLESLVSELGN